MKSTITNAPCVILFALVTAYSVEKGGSYRTHLAQLKKLQMTFQNLYMKSYKNWPMMSFIHSESKTTTYRITIDKKLDGTNG